MPIVHFTEYDARQLILARKFTFRVVRDTTRSDATNSEKKLVYDVRRKDMPKRDNNLRLCIRLAPSIPGVPKPMPGMSLQWKGTPIRKVDWALRHASIQSGVPVVYIKGWHEHIWTDEDQGKYTVPVEPPLKGCDIQSLTRWAAEKWNIEMGEPEQFDL